MTGCFDRVGWSQYIQRAMDTMRRILISLTLLIACAGSSQTPSQPDHTSHAAQFVTADDGGRLEVLDFGGTGRPMILLSGLGSDAHEWDFFAPKLVPQFHVYAITRRGF